MIVQGLKGQGMNEILGTPLCGQVPCSVPQPRLAARSIPGQHSSLFAVTYTFGQYRSIASPGKPHNTCVLLMTGGILSGVNGQVLENSGSGTSPLVPWV